MLQFRIRSLLILILIAAIFLGIAQTAGYAVAAGIIAAISVLVGAILWRRRGRFLCLRIGSAVLAVTAIWFLAVDWSWFVVECPDCRYHGDIAQHRVLGIPVHTVVYDHPSVHQLILADLGVPCEHANCESWHKHRRWGFVFLAWPSINGVYLLDDPNEYTDAMSARVRWLAANDPQQAAQLHRMLIHKPLWQTIDALTAGEPGNADSPATPP